MALTELSEGAEGRSEGFGGAIRRSLGVNPKEPEGKPKALEIFQSSCGLGKPNVALATGG